LLVFNELLCHHRSLRKQSLIAVEQFDVTAQRGIGNCGNSDKTVGVDELDSQYGEQSRVAWESDSYRADDSSLTWQRPRHVG